MSKVIKICCGNTLQFPLYCLFSQYFLKSLENCWEERTECSLPAYRFHHFSTAGLTMHNLLANNMLLIFIILLKYTVEEPI